MLKSDRGQTLALVRHSLRCYILCNIFFLSQGEGWLYSHLCICPCTRIRFSSVERGPRQSLQCSWTSNLELCRWTLYSRTCHSRFRQSLHRYVVIWAMEVTTAEYTAQSREALWKYSYTT